jgi:hypothetical protein
MMDFDKIITATPINRQTAKQMGGGINFDNSKLVPKHILCVFDCPPIADIPLVTRKSPTFRDFTGHKLGMLTVMGLSAAGENATGKGRWVVRCQCGSFGHLTAKAIKNGNIEMCQACLHIKKMREGRYSKKTKESKADE